MAKPNQVQPNQLWFSHWNTHKRLTINEIWLLSKMHLQRPFRYLNFCQNLWKNGLHPSWIHFGPLRTHFIQKIFFFPMLLYKIQTFLILDSFDDLPVVGWWNVLLVVQNEFQMVKNQFLNFFCWNWDIKRGIEDRVLKFVKMQWAWTFYRYFSVKITFGLVVIDFVWTWGQKQILLKKFCLSVPVDEWTEKFLKCMRFQYLKAHFYGLEKVACQKSW